MNEVKIKINKAHPHVELPKYQTTGSAGMDLCAYLDSDVVIPPLGRAKIPTGLRMEIPEGFEGQIRSRSGLALKEGLAVLNSPGTIDSDYRGEIEIILVNLGSEDVIIKGGQRIAQLVIAPVRQAIIVDTSGLNLTQRGAGGFGSTGK